MFFSTRNSYKFSENSDDNFVSPSNVNYYYGRLNRNEAEAVLKKSQPEDGMFLLRELSTELGNYAISIFSREKIYHYAIKRSPSNLFLIDGSGNGEFSSLLKVVDHIKSCAIPVKPSKPCNREEGIQPIRYLFVSEESFQDALTKIIRVKCKKEDEKERARGLMQHRYEYYALKELHYTQSWFKKNLNKSDVEKIFKNEKNRQSGRFILRTNYMGKYRLAVFYESFCDFHEYKIVHDNKTFFIKGSAGEDFRFLVQLVDFYGREKGCLKHRLTEPCIISDADFTNYSSNRCYKRLLTREVSAVPPPNLSELEPIECENFTLVIGRQLGSGNFSDVYHAIFNLKEANDSNKNIEVAVKLFKRSDPADVKREEIMMRSLDHPHIVKFIEHTENLHVRFSNLDPSSTKPALIMEYAKMGSLRSYMQSNKMSTSEILVIARQIADALKYLASKGKVHRDIALRNILLFSKDCAKLSDFGLSKDLDSNNYYNSTGTAEIPIKWYPPEAVLQNKFSEKSDVWSFGIMLWQAFSNGTLPFEEVKFHEFQDFLNKLTQRDPNKPVLSKPQSCPAAVYRLLVRCWAIDKDLRPNFGDICDELDALIADLSKLQIRDCDVESIGRGHFSEVFKLVIKNSSGEEEQLVVKVCRQINHLLKDQELNMLKSLDHAHIVKVLDPIENIKLPSFIHSLGDPILYMEYAKFGTFKEYLKGNHLEALVILVFMRQICDALAYMVRQGVVHRDVAARNILIFSETCAKLGDVGLSRTMDEDYYYRSSGTQPIPLKWYPPEAIVDQKFSEKSDAWSYGITLWEAFSNGAMPFQEIQNNKFLEYMRNIDDESQKLLKPLDCPENVFKIIEKCLHVNKSDRPTFEEIGDDLDLVMESLNESHPYINS